MQWVLGQQLFLNQHSGHLVLVDLCKSNRACIYNRQAEYGSGNDLDLNQAVSRLPYAYQQAT